MNDCQALDLLITPYIDGVGSAYDREVVQEHLKGCAACRARVAAESTARQVMRSHAAVSRTRGETPPWRPRSFRLGQPPLLTAHPVATSGLALAAVLLAVFTLRPQPVAAVGTIGDSNCGLEHMYATPNGDSQTCTLRCVARGARFILIADGKVYEIQNQDFPDLALFADRRVEVNGRFDGGRINVSALTLANP